MKKKVNYSRVGKIQQCNWEIGWREDQVGGNRTLLYLIIQLRSSNLFIMVLFLLVISNLSNTVHKWFDRTSVSRIKDVYT